MSRYRVTASLLWSGTFTVTCEAPDPETAQAQAVRKLRQQPASQLDPQQLPYDVLVAGVTALEPDAAPPAPPAPRFLIQVERRYREYFDVEAESQTDAMQRALYYHTADGARERVEIAAVVTSIIPPAQVGARTRCGNCRSVWYEAELEAIDNLGQRLEPGGEVPAGQCPNCGSLAYLEEDDAPPA